MLILIAGLGLVAVLVAAELRLGPMRWRQVMLLVVGLLFLGGGIFELSSSGSQADEAGVRGDLIGPGLASAVLGMLLVTASLIVAARRRRPEPGPGVRRKPAGG